MWSGLCDSVECEVGIGVWWSVECKVESVECKVKSLEWAVWSVKWGLECGL